MWNDSELVITPCRVTNYKSNTHCFEDVLGTGIVYTLLIDGRCFDRLKGLTIDWQESVYNVLNDNHGVYTLDEYVATLHCCSVYCTTALCA